MYTEIIACVSWKQALDAVAKIVERVAMCPTAAMPFAAADADQLEALARNIRRHIEDCDEMCRQVKALKKI